MSTSRSGSSPSFVITASINSRTASASRARSGVAKSGGSGNPGAASLIGRPPARRGTRLADVGLLFGCVRRRSHFLTALVVRLALLGERLRALLRVFAGEDLPADLVLVLH